MVPPPKGRQAGDHANADGIEPLARALNHAGQGKRQRGDHFNGHLGLRQSPGSCAVHAADCRLGRLLPRLPGNVTLARLRSAGVCLPDHL